MTNSGDFIFSLTFVTALGCGLIAGVFFAFSVFVMKALSRLPSSQAIAAMQAINLAVINPIFMLVFLGTAVLSLLVIITALLNWQVAGAAYLVSGGSLYLLGSFLVTLMFNVPRNNALARLNPSDPKSASVWSGYLVSWTRWNHLRTIGGLVALTLLILALIQ
jgi:uncharacterized membrane protein